MTTLERSPLIRERDRFERRVRRFFADAGLLEAAVPAADIAETEDEYVIELEVAGFDEAHLDVEVVSDHILVVKGERETHDETHERSFLLHERLDRTFERRFELPYAADADHIAAEFAAGVLTLHIPKTAAAKRRQVEINRR